MLLPLNTSGLAAAARSMNSGTSRTAVETLAGKRKDSPSRATMLIAMAACIPPQSFRQPAVRNRHPPPSQRPAKQSDPQAVEAAENPHHDHHEKASGEPSVDRMRGAEDPPAGNSGAPFHHHRRLAAVAEDRNGSRSPSAAPRPDCRRNRRTIQGP